MPTTDMILRLGLAAAMAAESTGLQQTAVVNSTSTIQPALPNMFAETVLARGLKRAQDEMNYYVMKYIVND